TRKSPSPNGATPSPCRPVGARVFGRSNPGLTPWAIIYRPFGAEGWSLQLHRPVGGVEERLPRPVLRLRQLEVQQRAALRLLRLADQRHVRLPGGPPALADVAVHARADDVVPGRPAPLAPRDHVVQAQLRGRVLPPAVLAL